LADISREIAPGVQPFLRAHPTSPSPGAAVYPRLVLQSPRLAEFSDRFRLAANLDQAAFWKVISDEARTGQSLPDVLVNKGLLSAGRSAKNSGLKRSAALLSTEQKSPSIALGLTNWALLLVVASNVARARRRYRHLSAAHPELQQWLSEKIGTKLTFMAELAASR